MLKEVQIANYYATKAHASVNHTYDGKPYSFHLNMVYNFGVKFQHLLPEDKVIITLSACWTHDLIEDCRLSYNDISKKFGVIVADITYNLSNNKGKTRAERANNEYYQYISFCRYSTFVKICDRLANATHSKNSGSRMFEMYKKENENFRNNLYTSELQEMWDELDDIFGIER